MSSLPINFKQLAQFYIDSAEQLLMYITSKEPKNISYFPCDIVIYIAGYAVEMILKDKIASDNDCKNINDFEQFRKNHKPKIGGRTGHELQILLRQANLEQNLMNAQASNGIRIGRFAWKSIEKIWKPTMRYEISTNLFTKRDARTFIEDVTTVINILKENY